MLFNPNALDMVPFLTLSFTLHHRRILVGLSIPANAILFGIFGDGARLNSRFDDSFSPFDLLQLVSCIFFRLTSHRCIPIFPITVPSFFLLLGLRAWVLLGIQSYIRCEVIAIGFSLSFLSTGLNNSLLMYLLIGFFGFHLAVG